VRGYALSSAVTTFPLTSSIGCALLENLRRLEAAWHEQLTSAAFPGAAEWGCAANVELVWSSDVGAIPADPDLCVVQIVESLPDAPEDLAYHTVDALGRPLCLISYAACRAEGATDAGPGGVVEAIAHEILESRADPTCLHSVPLPSGGRTPLEVCDWVQGSGYTEQGVPGIYVANFVTPRFFNFAITGAFDGRLGDPAVTAAFQETPGGYHEVEAPDGTVSQVFGEHVRAATKARLMRVGARGGLRRARR
jgi:hypothetical protein